MTVRAGRQAGVLQAGSGSVLAIAVLAAVLCVASLLVPLGSVVIARQRVTTGADAAALAAADVSAGILPGVPCTAAAAVAEANGLVAHDCELHGAVATVSVSSTVMGFTITGRATAGPPGTGED